MVAVALFHRILVINRVLLVVRVFHVIKVLLIIGVLFNVFLVFVRALFVFVLAVLLVIGRDVLFAFAGSVVLLVSVGFRIR